MLLAFLSLLDSSSIDHVSWKNNHEIKQCLDGLSDLDIFVPLKFKSSFISIATSEKWIELINPACCFPYVKHFYKVDSSGNIFHLHVYFRIVTGDSWLKEFILPFDNFFIENKCRCPETGVWILNPNAQYYIFLIRHYLKNSSLIGRLLYRKQISSYNDEYISFATQVLDLSNPLFPFLIPYYFQSIHSKKGMIVPPSIFKSLIFRIYFLSFQRFSSISLPFRKIVAFILRLYNKLLARKKVFSDEGLVIAISGVDGSGKSTLFGYITHSFGKFITVKKVYLGRPLNRNLEKFARLLISSQPKFKPASKYIDNKKGTSSIKYAFISLFIALVRLYTATRAQFLARSGFLVFADRWPCATTGMMDGPRIKYSPSSNNCIINFLKSLEIYIYRSIPPSDITIFLDVSIETALNRNRNRIKEYKETDLEIIQRHTSNHNAIPVTSKLIKFNNNLPCNLALAQILSITWDEIVDHCSA